MLTVGNDELGDEIEKVLCPRCGDIHGIEYGKSRKMLPDGTMSEWEESKSMGFYKCGGKIYLATIDGKALPNVEGR